MKSKLLVLAISMLGMSFLAANGAVDAKKVIATSAAVEVKADKEVAVADAAQKEVAAEEVAKAEAAKAKKAEENKTPQDQKSCKSCR
jgi:hypothetical protein